MPRFTKKAMSDNSDEIGEQESAATGDARTDATGEFFSVGTPLHAVRAGYVRRKADDLLFESVIAGRYAHVIAPDRSGKSSLIAATAARLENNDYHVAVLDLQQIGGRDAGTDAGRWYYNVAYRLLRQLRIRFELQSWWQDKSVLSNRQRLLEFYSEIILGNLQKQVVIFVDEVQCIESLSFADQLLASIRAAHNARTVDPDFSRLTFVLLGECDPLSLVSEPELSPFNVTQSILLGDFSRADLDIFATELNVLPDDAERVLDRIYHWTRGQPYLSQKLARAVARENLTGEFAGQVDRIVKNQLAGRAALHSEPHMSHIHREIVGDESNREALLTLYGRLRKGIEVPADLGSAIQRRLMAVGLLEVNESGELRIRNRIYERVFTARWANENLPTHWRTPAIAVAVLLVVALIPLWYTQWLPKAYQDVLIAGETELPVARSAWMNLRSFPLHSDTADDMYRSFLNSRAAAAETLPEIRSVAAQASELPDAGSLPQRMLSTFWDERAQAAMREEQRDDALLNTLNSLVLSTPVRRNRGSMLVGDDYPLLLASLPAAGRSNLVFNAGSLLLTSTEGAEVSQWSLGPQGLTASEPWAVTALEVTPLVRRVIVDREGSASRLGLSLNISHPRIADLRIKLIAPSGRAVEIDVGLERVSSSEEVRIPASQLSGLLGESLNGTWSLSVRDEATGVAGHLVGWNLRLNSQALIEDFQRGIGIPDPTERETEQYWIGKNGRYAIARATQSDSARLWDLAFAKPVSTLAISENEQLIGLDAGARQLITATLDSVNIWDTATGTRRESLPITLAGGSASLSEDGQHLFVQYRSDLETRFELWDLNVAEKDSEFVVAGAPALIGLSADGQRIAIADYDRAVRVWDFLSGEMLAQIDLPMQPSALQLSAGGNVLGAVFATSGVALWSVEKPQQALLEEYGEGAWQMQFSASGARFVIGRPRTGFQIYDALTGTAVGPALGLSDSRSGNNMLEFGRDEDVLVTGGANDAIRFWRIPKVLVPPVVVSDAHSIWNASGDKVVAALPDASGFAIADRSGHVHFADADWDAEQIRSASEDVSFLGHLDAITLMTVSADGRQLASVGADDALRVWDSASGLPREFITNLPATDIRKIEFSPDGSLVAVLNEQWIAVVDATSGELLVSRNLDAGLSSASFGPDNRLYLGSDNGSLDVIARAAGGSWTLQRLWQGESGIRWLVASPRGRYLALVDDANVAKQFNLLDGLIGEAKLQLPAPLEEVKFSPSGSRVLFRTSRWIHRANASSSGLRWMDSMFTPKALAGTGMVFGDSEDAESLSGSRLYLPVGSDGGIQLAELEFGDSDGAGLFGNREDLLSDWRKRLAVAPTAVALQEE
jgi:WD40 repeat protein